MAVNLPAVWIFAVVISLQYIHYTTGFHENRRIRSSGKIISQIVELKEGTKSTYLNCTTVMNGTKVKVYWKKDGVSFPKRDISLDRIPIFYASCKHEGNYTCFTYGSNSAIITLKEFLVKVLAQATQNNSVCGDAKGKDLWQESDICIPQTIYDYRCCNRHIRPPVMLQLSQKFSSIFKNKCKEYTKPNYTAWEINAKWNLPDNATWIWGWQVTLTGLDNNLNVKRCVQINSKNKLLNWTFDGLPFGGKYGIKIQALPSDEKNYLVKNTVLPRKIDLCKEIGRKCQWEICFPVTDVQQIVNTSALTWRPSKYHKTQHYFEINYNSSDANCRDSGKKKVKENETRIDLSIHKCRSYYVKVRPIFSIAGEGTFSKAIIFYPPSRPTGPPSTKQKPAEYTDIIVTCIIVIALLIVALIIIILVKRRRKTRNPSVPLIVPDVPDWVIPNVANKTEVLIVHDNHCQPCNNVTYLLANILNKTGYVECILDFCCKNEIAERGMRWYEDKMKSCDKIIVVCTKDGKKIFDEKEEKTEGPYNFILKTLLGEMVNHGNKHLQIIPVYFDISSNEDVPLFLSQYKCYSVPSHLQELLLALRTDCIDSSNKSPSHKISQTVDKFRSAIEMMGRNHKGYKTWKLDETTPL